MAKNVNIETIQFKLQDFGKLKAVDKTFNKLNKSLGFTPNAAASFCVSSITCLPLEAQYLAASISFPFVHLHRIF